MKHERPNNSSYMEETKTSTALQCMAILLLTLVTGGATCMPRRSIPEFQPKPVFTTPPTQDQLTEAINRSRNVQSLQSNSVTVNVNNERTINTNVTWAREKRFRMTASVAGFAGVDIGSNDEVFWMAIRGGLTKEMYFARHVEFESQVDRPVLPVSPIWLIQAMGICEIKSRLVQDPVTRADGLVELTTEEPSPIGNYTRTLVVDPKYGFTRQVFLRDPTGRLVANAQQSKHEYYASVQSSLPHHIKVQLIPSGSPLLEIDISIASYVVNSLATDNMTQFVMPNTNGYQVVNLGQSGPQAIVPQQVAPPQLNYPQVSYRGVPWDGVITR